MARHCRNTSFGIALLLCSCGAEQDDPRQQAIALNNKAAQTFHKAPEEALQLLDEAIAADPNYIMAYSTKAAFLGSLERYKEAAEVMGEAVHLDPDFVEGHIGRGAFLEKAGKTDEAQACYKKAVMLLDERLVKNPEDSYARAHRAFLIYLQGSEKEAMRILDKMIEDDPGDSLASGVRDVIKSGFRPLGTASKK